MQQEHCAGAGHLKFGKGNLMGTFTRGRDLKRDTQWGQVKGTEPIGAVGIWNNDSRQGQVKGTY